MSSVPLHGAVRYWRAAELPGVEARAARYRGEPFRTHTHDSLSLGLILGGSTRFFLYGRPRSARCGQVVVIPPQAPHACNPDPGCGLSYRMFALAPGLWAEAAGGRELDLPPVLDDARLFSAANALFDALIAARPPSGMRELLFRCLRALADRHGRPTEPRVASGDANPAVERVRKRLAAHPGVFWPLGDLARAADLSPRQFLRAFKARTGLSPHSYQVQRAVERAKSLIAGGMALSQAALEAGFADQSHFSRRFREFTGATPGQYAAQVFSPRPRP